MLVLHKDTQKKNLQKKKPADLITLTQKNTNLDMYLG